MLLETDPIEYLLRARPKLKRGHSRNKEVQRILSLLKDPHLSFKSVHVGGTNGKGSVSTKIACALERSGYKVGLFTSPHLFSLTERIEINSQPISEDYIRKSMDLIHSVSQSPLHFFEYMFIIASLYFRDKGIDIAVIEVGIGGKFDTTNCIRSITSVITSIGEDHKEILGDSLHEIAEQKAGIIKKGFPVVLGPTADYPCMHIHGGIVMQVEKQDSYIQDNIATAEKALEAMSMAGLTLSPAAIASGLLASPPCRLEKRGKHIFDIAHNPPALKALVQQLPKGFVPVVGFSKTKDITQCLKELLPLGDTIVIAPKIHDMLEEPDIIGQIARQLGFDKVLIAADEKKLAELLILTKRSAVVCGSAYIMAVQIPQT